MRIGRLIITVAPRELAPVDALKEGAASPGLYICEQPAGCGWAFRYLGQDQWMGAYWRREHEWEKTHDSRCEWSGYPKLMSTQELEDNYSDCFGRLVFLEPMLHRRWNGEPLRCPNNGGICQDKRLCAICPRKGM